jgi:PAS domain S-box-containing protein
MVTEIPQPTLSVFECNPLPSWICDTKTFKILEANKSAVKTYGYSKSGWKEFVVTDFIEIPKGLKKKPHHFIGTVTHKSGKHSVVRGYVNNLVMRKKKYYLLVVHEYAERNGVANTLGTQQELPSQKEKSNDEIIIRSKQLESILNSLLDGFFTVDKNWTITLCNKVTPGYDSKELVGKNLWESFPYLYDSTTHEKCMLAMRSGEPLRFEHVSVLEKGYVFDVHAYPYNGGLLLSFKNITDRKKEEEELSRLALIANRTNNAVILTDRHGKITWTNEGFKRITGYSQQEVMGKKPGHLLQGENTNPESVRMMREALRQGHGFNVELLNYTKSGKPYWVDVEVIPLKNDDDEVTGYIAIELEITQLKTAVFEMLRSQEQLQTIVNNIPMDVFMKDLKGRYIFYNRSFENHFSGTHRPLAVTDYDLFEKAEADTFHASDLCILKSGETLTVEQDIVSKGKVETYYIVKFPLYDVSNKIYAIAGVSLRITERKQMERALRESEERMRMAQKAAHISTWDWDIPNNKVQWHGIKQVEHSTLPVNTYHDFLNIVHAEDRSMVHNSIQEALNSKNQYYAEFRVAWPNGKHGWLLGSGSVFRKNSEEPTRMVGIYMDITARKEAEEALKKSHQLLQETTSRLLLATEAAHIGIWEWSVSTDESLWNEKMYEIFGLTPSHHKNTLQAWLNCIHPEDSTRMVEMLTAAIDEYKDFHCEYRIIRPDGSVRDITNYAMVQRDECGRAIKFIGVNWDITDQKKSETDLKHSEARYRSIVDNQIEMICRYTSDGTLTFVNQAYAEKFGHNQNLIGKRFIQFIPEENRGNILQYIQQIFEGTIIPRPIEQQNLVNGEWKWHEWYDMPLRNENGEVFEIQSIGHDITNRKKLEAEQARLDKIVRESYNEIYLFNDHNLNFDFANASALKNLGYTAEEFSTLRLPDLFTYPDEMALRILLGSLRNAETDRLQLQLKHRRKDGSQYDVDVLIQVLEKDRSFVAIVSDITAKLITERKLMDTIHEKETLIKEIHHRVKNNLQLISSIIYLKMVSLGQSDIRTFLENTRQKIRSIAMIHERLLQTEKLDKVEISDYLGKLIHDLQITYVRQDLHLEVRTDIHEKVMNLDTAIICGLIVNELVTNSIKHAFSTRTEGLIDIAFHYDKSLSKCSLRISDDGISLPEHIIPGNVNSFGMQLLDVFVKQLGGTIEIYREKGTIFLIRF